MSKIQIDHFLENVNVPEGYFKDPDDELVLFLSNDYYQSIKNEIVDGQYKGYKVKVQKKAPEGLIWITPS